MQHFLKPASRSAWTGIVASEFFEQFLVAVNEADTRLDLCLGREPITPLA
jgi:hypothetical protein